MRTSSHGLPTQSHSNETEHRLTKLEVGHEISQGKISYLERAVQGLIYATTAIAVGKSGDVVELLLSLLKTKP